MESGPVVEQETTYCAGYNENVSVIGLTCLGLDWTSVCTYVDSPYTVKQVGTVCLSDNLCLGSGLGPNTE